MHLHDRRSRAARAAAAGGTVGVEEVVRGQVQAERDPDARVHAGGDLRGPVPGVGQPLGPPRGERQSGGVGRGGRAGQGVGDGVEEGADQRLRPGQAQGARAGQRHRVALVREGGGDRAQVGHVVRFERAGAPGVVPVGGEAGQQAAPGGEAQGVQGGGAPAGGGRVGRRIVPGADQQGQGLVHGQGQRGDGTAAHTRAVRAHDGEVRTPGVPGLRGHVRALGVVEGDPAVAREGCGQEHGRQRRHDEPVGRHGAFGRHRRLTHTPCHLPARPSDQSSSTLRAGSDNRLRRPGRETPYGTVRATTYTRG